MIIKSEYDEAKYNQGINDALDGKEPVMSNDESYMKGYNESSKINDYLDKGTNVTASRQIQSSRRNNMIKSSWKQFIKGLDKLEKREELKEMYNSAHWEFLDYIMPCDPQWTEDMNDSDFNPLDEIYFLFKSSSDIEEFLFECAKENLPGAKEKLRRIRQINTCNRVHSSRQIKSAKSQEEFEDLIIDIENRLGVNVEHSNIFNLPVELTYEDECYIDDICREQNCRFIPVNGSRRQYRLIQSSRRIQSMRTPKNVYLNEDTQKLIQRLEKRVGHELKLKFEEGNTPYVEIEKLPKGGHSFITKNYLNKLAENYLFDGYKEKQDSFIVYLDPAIMYTKPEIKSALDTVKITFDNGDTIVTDYNADVGREEIAKYYMHNYFNVGGEDEMHQVVKVEFPDSINSARTPEVADMQDAEDLALFAENDVELYNTVIKPTFDNLQRKLKRGIYDKNKALIAWEHVIDEAAKAYDRQLGSRRGTMTMFNKATRKEAAKILMDSIWDEDEWQA